MPEIDIGEISRSIGVNKSYKVGEHVFEQGDPGDCMFVIHSGTIELRVEETLVDICKENETVGYMSIIDGSERSSTAVAVTDVEVSIINAEQFNKLVDEMPGFAAYVMQTMAQRIRGMAKAIDFLFT